MSSKKYTHNAIISSLTVGNLAVSGGSSLGTGPVNTGLSSIFSGSFNAANNVSNQNVTGLSFDTASIGSFVAVISVKVIGSSTLNETFTFEGTQLTSGWSTFLSSVGDNSGITFAITSGGQVTYTAPNTAGWTSTTMRFSVTQIANTGTYSGTFVTTGNYQFADLQLNNTTDAVSGVSNGALNVLGGATIAKTLRIPTGGSLIATGSQHTIGSITISGGNVGIGTTAPASSFHARGDISFGPSKGDYLNLNVNVGWFRIKDMGNTTELFTVASNRQVYTGNVIPFADNTYVLGWAGGRYQTVYAVNGTIQTSDITLKNEVPLTYGLNELMNVNTIKFKWNNLPEDDPTKDYQYFGFDAQNLRTIFPELVYDEGESDGTPLGVNYTEMLPVCVKAIQELKAENDQLKSFLRSKFPGEI